jgi:phosphate-selective porin OprO and OprP
MMAKTIWLVALLGTFVCTSTVNAQTKPAITFYAKKGKGYGLVTADSTFSLNFQFRIQNRAAVYTKSLDDFDPGAFEFRTRRLRLKFDGFVYSPKIGYYIQLSFSRGDMDWRGTDNSDVNSSVNVVRDAVIFYNPRPKLRLAFGQTKLPGNRQRVISSGDQQFADRSIVNSTFNIDRDFGFFAHYTENYFVLRGAITSGEGRNSFTTVDGNSATTANSGLAWTGRVEILPFGKFTGNNDYMEGDLEREPKPKLSIASTYSYNDKAMRQAGQLGNDLYENRGIRNFEIDALFKYKGWAFYNEYMMRDAARPVTVLATDISKTRAILVGRGYLSQLSYLFKNNWEVAGRYSTTIPFHKLYSQKEERRIEQVEAGFAKYLSGHRLKIQGNLVYNAKFDLYDAGLQRNIYQFNNGWWSGIFQVEIGI